MLYIARCLNCLLKLFSSALELYLLYNRLKDSLYTAVEFDRRTASFDYRSRICVSIFPPYPASGLFNTRFLFTFHFLNTFSNFFPELQVSDACPNQVPFVHLDY
jgi:hypothetical protein